MLPNSPSGLSICDCCPTTMSSVGSGICLCLSPSALPLTTIGASDINAELVRSINSCLCLNDTTIRSLAGRTTAGSCISFSDLQGKCFRCTICYTFPANCCIAYAQICFCNLTYLNGGTYVPGHTDYVVTIPPSTVLYTLNCSCQPALLISSVCGKLRTGDTVRIIVQGRIQGAGGCAWAPDPFFPRGSPIACGFSPLCANPGDDAIIVCTCGPVNTYIVLDGGTIVAGGGAGGGVGGQFNRTEFGQYMEIRAGGGSGGGCYNDQVLGTNGQAIGCVMGTLANGCCCVASGGGRGGQYWAYIGAVTDNPCRGVVTNAIGTNGLGACCGFGTYAGGTGAAAAAAIPGGGTSGSFCAKGGQRGVRGSGICCNLYLNGTCIIYTGYCSDPAQNGTISPSNWAGPSWAAVAGGGGGYPGQWGGNATFVVCNIFTCPGRPGLPCITSPCRGGNTWYSTWHCSVLICSTPCCTVGCIYTGNNPTFLCTCGYLQCCYVIGIPSIQF
jgi:hypothetical protein